MKKIIVLTLVLFAVGCSNAGKEEWNSRSGHVTLYSADGSVIREFETVGKAEQHQGGHLYFRSKDTGELTIVYGTYVFREGE